jgi:nitroreductase
MNADEFLEVLRTRRSVRKFLPDPIPEEDIEKIITAASWAPSGTNHQNWHFIVIRTDAIKMKMAQVITEDVAEMAKSITFSQAQKGFLAYTNFFTFFNKAPVVIAVVKKPYNSVTDRIFSRYNLAAQFTSTTAVQGPAAAIQNLVLMAHALGYGTCWMTGPLVAKKRLEETLSINNPDELMALIPLGKPAHIAGAPHRKKLKEIIAYI